MFYSPDPVLYDDPTSLLDDPGLASVYSYANSNPLAFGDPDGRKPLMLTGAQRLQLRHDLRAAGVDDPELRSKIKSFFANRTGLRAKITFSILGNYSRLKAAQDFAEKWDMKPVVQFEIDNKSGSWKLQNIKFSVGTGRRAKLDFAADAPGGNVATTPPNGVSGGAAAGGASPPTASAWKPAVKSCGAITNTSSAGTAGVTMGTGRSDGGS